MNRDYPELYKKLQLRLATLSMSDEDVEMYYSDTLKVYVKYYPNRNSVTFYARYVDIIDFMYISIEMIQLEYDTVVNYAAVLKEKARLYYVRINS